MGYELHPLPMLHDNRVDEDYTYIANERVLCQAAWYTEEVIGEMVRRRYFARPKALEPGRLIYDEIFQASEEPDD